MRRYINGRKGWEGREESFKRRTEYRKRTERGGSHTNVFLADWRPTVPRHSRMGPEQASLTTPTSGDKKLIGCAVVISEVG